MLTNINSLNQKKEVEKIVNLNASKLYKRRYFCLWTQEEEKKLLILVREYGKKWSLISSYFEGKNQYDCFYHYCRNLKAGWKKEEDDKMMNFLKENKNCWKACGEYMNKKAKDCYERYKILRNKKGNYSLTNWGLDQELKLVLLVSKIGKCWNIIERYFPERRKDQICKKFYSLLRNYFKKTERIEDCLHHDLENLMKYLPFLINEIQRKILNEENGRNKILAVFNLVSQVTKDNIPSEKNKKMSDSNEKLSLVNYRKLELKEMIKNKIKSKLMTVLRNKMQNIPSQVKFQNDFNEGNIQELLNNIHQMTNLIQKVKMAIKY